MPKGIDRFVSENRRDTRRIDSTFVEVASQRPQRFNFGVNRIQVPTTIKVYSRPLNDSLISGHPKAKQGSGRGVAGDVRGSWSLETDTEVSEEFVIDGRENIRDTLTGESSTGVDKIVVGSGTNAASGADTQLQSKNTDNLSWSYQGQSSDITKARTHFLFGETNGNIAEYGVLNNNDKLYNRITTTTITPDNTQEIRVDVKFEVKDGANGDGVITNDGQDAVAEAIRNDGVTIGIDEFVFGQDDTTPQESDSTLGNKAFSKVAEREKEPEKVNAHTVVFESEPNGQPYTIKEIGVNDNNGRLLWRTIIDPFDKDDTVDFEVFAAFRAK